MFRSDIPLTVQLAVIGKGLLAVLCTLIIGATFLVTYLHKVPKTGIESLEQIAEEDMKNLPQKPYKTDSH